jgi:hypothetical protein
LNAGEEKNKDDGNEEQRRSLGIRRRIRIRWVKGMRRGV